MMQQEMDLPQVNVGFIGMQRDICLALSAKLSMR